MARVRVLAVFQSRMFASKFNGGAFSLEQAAKIKQITTAYKKNPDIQRSLQKVKAMLDAKGFDGRSPPSVFKIMLLLAEKEMRDALSEVKSALERDNIELTASDVQAFMSYYGHVGEGEGTDGK